MKKNNFDDSPLFPDETIGGAVTTKTIDSGSNSMNIESVKEQAGILSRLRLLDFSFKIITSFSVIIVILVIADIVVQKLFGVENTLIGELFDLLKYSITTVLGYLFASKQSE